MRLSHFSVQMRNTKETLAPIVDGNRFAFAAISDSTLIDALSLVVADVTQVHDLDLVRVQRMDRLDGAHGQY